MAGSVIVRWVAPRSYVGGLDRFRIQCRRLRGNGAIHRWSPGSKCAASSRGAISQEAETDYGSTSLSMEVEATIAESLSILPVGGGRGTGRGRGRGMGGHGIAADSQAGDVLG